MLELNCKDICVAGDVILDEYVFCSNNRLSPEAPVPLLDIETTVYKLGGAANVANNCRALNALVNLIGITGDDSGSNTIRELLEQKAIGGYIKTAQGYKTNVKKRVMVDTHQIVRMDITGYYNDVDKSELNESYDVLLREQGTLIISDYNKGTLSDVQTLIKKAKKKCMSIIVDPKGDSFDKYTGADYLTPNIHEVERIVGKCNTLDDLDIKGSILINSLKLNGMLVTMGKNGMYYIERCRKSIYINSFAKHAIDVTGAGDTVAAVFGMAIGSRYDGLAAAYIANAAASVVVKQIGTSTASLEEINKVLSEFSPIVGNVLIKDRYIENEET